MGGLLYLDAGCRQSVDMPLQLEGVRMGQILQRSVVMRVHAIFYLTAMLVFWMGSGVLWAQDAPARIMLNDHEPNLLGYSYDQDDGEAFLDFKISLQYPIARAPLEKLSSQPWFPLWAKAPCANRWFDNCQPYIAFTGRFGQYIKVRHSSPVISKRFNPKLFWRFSHQQGRYFDLEYGHESNGQSITSLDSYNAQVAELMLEDEGKASYANDYISRGWDYVGWNVKQHWDLAESGKRWLDFYLGHQHYVGGVLQGEIEEYYDWEPVRDIRRREQVNGWRAMLVFHDNMAKVVDTVWEDFKFALIFETGRKQMFEYNTLQAEMGTRLFDMPLIFWGRRGYNSDLAMYHRRVSSYGVALELRTFD